MNRKILFLVLVFSAVLFVGLIPKLVVALPSGGTIVSVSNSTAAPDSAGPHAAIAGNVTEITVTGVSTTQSWQGYYGNVTGTIELGDASGNAMYNWSQATAGGEVYATNFSTAISWSTIKCLNESDRYTTLESFYNIGSNDVDGVDETFSLNNHAQFEVGSISFPLGQCNNTQVFGPGGAATFDEVLLEDSANKTVFAALLDDNTAGFDGLNHDFEMLVLEDGHSGDTTSVSYYFYVELEG